MEKIHHPPTSQDTLINSEVRGLELREEVRVWEEVAASEARMTLMKSMIKEQLAFADLEEFGIEFTNKLKSVNTKNKTLYKKVSRRTDVEEGLDEIEDKDEKKTIINYRRENKKVDENI